jgi:tRNA(Ile)-lysidine synthase
VIHQTDFDRQLKFLLPDECRHLVVALSGGIDSVVLAHLCHHFAKTHPEFSLKAVHVNHGLSPKANAWQAFCSQLCADWGILSEGHRVVLDVGARQSLEAVARERRYEVFGSVVDEHTALLTAQHGDDQSETLLLNLKRGSGPAGLAAMPPVRSFSKGWLVRPLLTQRRAAIERYAKTHELSWVEDESNQDPRFDRNFLRLQVVPMLEARWPGFTASCQRSAQLLQESQLLMDELASSDLAQTGDRQSLDVECVLALSPARRHNVLRYWFKQGGWRYPSQSQLAEIIKQLGGAVDGQPQVQLADGQVRRYRGRLYRVSNLMPPLASQAWDMQTPVDIAGFVLKALSNGTLRRPPDAVAVWVRFRDEVGNPDFYPAGRGGSRPLKKLLQELGFPPWLRSQVPLIYYGDTLVAIADRLIHQQWVEPNPRGLALSWQTCDDTWPGQRD